MSYGIRYDTGDTKKTGKRQPLNAAAFFVTLSVRLISGHFLTRY